MSVGKIRMLYGLVSTHCKSNPSTILIDVSRVMLHIVTSLTDDSRGIIYDCNMFVVQATR
jgi:hypothetical protein